MTSTNNRIRIYHLNGKLIKEFVTGPAGTQTIIWDKKDARGYPVSNGCYILKMSSNYRCCFFRIVSGM